MTNSTHTVNQNDAVLPKRAYHHGDLRAALIDAGLTMLEETAADTISLRELARRVGVTATAIYRHFPDKDSLLVALAQEGFNRLAEAQRLGADGAGVAAFANYGRAYVRFALAHPSLFRLMFAANPMTGDPFTTIDPRSPAALLRRGALAVAGEGASEDEVIIIMLRAWSLVHGLAMLILDRQIDLAASAPLIDRIIAENDHFLRSEFIRV